MIESQRGSTRVTALHIEDQDGEVVPAGSATMALLVSADTALRGLDRRRYRIRISSSSRVLGIKSLSSPSPALVESPFDTWPEFAL
jgi:hypothetical protein